MLKEAARQLDRYFAGKLKRFDLPLAARGTDFQKRVWTMMRDIPYGETATYGGMAMALGSGRAPSAWPARATPSRSSCPAIACWAAAARKAASPAARACRPTQLLALEGVSFFDAGARHSSGASGHES